MSAKRAQTHDVQEPTRPKAGKRTPIDVIDESVEFGAAIREIPVRLITPHPRNPGRHRITSENIAALAADIEAHGLQQPVKLRPAPGSPGRYQIIFGERRYQAVMALGGVTINAIVAEATDRQVGCWQASENAQRVDIDVVSKAQHLAQLTNEQEDGSPALTQAEAGEVYGITQGEVSNLIRMLRLPSKWVDLVRAGTLTVKQVRSIVPYADSGKLLDLLYDDCTRDRNGRWSIWSESGEDLDLDIEQLVMEETRPVDKKTKHDHRGSIGWSTRQFELTSEIRQQLDIVLVPLGKRPSKSAARPMVERAINSRLWDTLNLPLAKAKADAQRAKQGNVPAEFATEPGQAVGHDSAAKDAKRAEQLGGLIATWRERMLRATIAQQLDAGTWLPMALSTYVLAGAANRYGQGIAYEWLSAASAMTHKRPHATHGQHSLARPWREQGWELWTSSVRPDDDPIADCDLLHLWVSRLALWPVGEHLGLRGEVYEWLGSDLPKLSDPILQIGEVLDTCCSAMEVSVTKAWTLAVEDGPQRELVRQLLEAHTKDELWKLTQFADPGSKKSDLVEHLLDQHRPGRIWKMPTAWKGKGKGK